MWKLLVILNVLYGLVRSEEVIVIGAGPAGIAAATKLIENNITNIIVLEAQSRIGGRIHSVYFGNSFVDLGAEFIHGEKGNIVYELANEYILPNILGQKLRLYYSNGIKFDKELTETISETLDSYYESLEKIDESSNTVSIGEDFLKIYKASVLERYNHNNDSYTKATDSIDVCESIFLSSEGTFNWYDSLAKSTYKECEGDQFQNWSGLGYKTILAILMKRFPNKSTSVLKDSQILLNTRAKKIIWNEKQFAKVICEDGSSFTAKHIIFTPSVGVLKAHWEDLFEPRLPKFKEDAIKAVGFSGVMKIFLHFPTKWWSNYTLPLYFVWSKNDKVKLARDTANGPIVNGQSWLTRLLRIAPLPKNPNVFTIRVTGPHVPQIEKLPTKQIKNGAMFVLKKFLGKDYNITEPDDIIFSTWCKNPNTRGTYSYTTRAASELELPFPVQLQKSLLRSNGEPAVLFAGEATHLTKFSTVHGAIETGHREATTIINLKKQ